jgi:hypothetical protein
VTDNDGDSDSATTTANVSAPPTVPDTSINSTSQTSSGVVTLPVAEQPIVPNTNYSVLAINDLGMHCGDLDTRIASILPPFQAMLGQVIRKGAHPTLNPEGVSLWYSAASNPADPVLDGTVFDGLMLDGSTYKTNFWDYPIPAGTYDAFYPAYNPFIPAQTLTPLAGPPFNVGPDVGLPVPNVEELYIGHDGVVDSGDESLTAVQHAMPGLSIPYIANAPRQVLEHYIDKPFFINFPFGYVAEDVNWLEGAGIPFAAFDDFGRENAYPLVRVEARDSTDTVLATVDTVLPISGEASCTNCHSTQPDYISVHGGDETDTDHRTNGPTDALGEAGLPVATTVDEPDDNIPPRVSLEYAADINVLRLHDLKHGANYVSTACDEAGQNCLVTAPAPCDITANGGNGDANCLTHKALLQDKPVVCQVCHYTPALDLAQLGPLAGPEGSLGNGRNQLAHQSNSRVMHHHHGQFAELFTPIPAPVQDATTGVITNQGTRLAALEQNCYQCHPGKNTQCLRGAMFNGGMLCSDCHGSMEQVGADFTGPVAGDPSSEPVSPHNPADFKLVGLGNFYNSADPQPRVPWANEPGCGSCHTGDATDNLAGTTNTVVNSVDSGGNVDGIRLRQAFLTGDAKATPIVPTNTRFAEPIVPAEFNGFANPGAGNPQLYRVSTGHGGVMCEGCHGATHAEWPNGNPFANDNVTANQLQGHTGTITECDTCHDATAFEDSGVHELTMNGPHGMHPVGSVHWNTHHKEARVGGGANCRGCHGQNGEGTVLSRMTAERVLQCKDNSGDFCSGEGPKRFPKGHMVGCNDCHRNHL